MVKIGVRTPSLNKSVRARTTGSVTRTVKRSVNPVYGKKGTGFITNPERSIKNAVYHRTTVGINPLSNMTATKTNFQNKSVNQFDESISIHQLPLDFVNNHNVPEDKLLLKIKDVETNPYDDNISTLISNISGDIERDELYDNLKRNEIIDFHFGEKIYQFDFYTIDIHTSSIVTRNNGIYELKMKNRLISEFLTIGTIPSKYNEVLDNILSDDSLDIKISVNTSGGNYKRTSENKNGSISVRNYKEPLKFSLLIYDTRPRKEAEESVIADYYQALQDQQDAEQKQTNNFATGCAAIIFAGLLIVIAIISSIFS
ncbi:hypothetical protein ACPBEI_07395 [Latilactobacillus sakei]